MRAYCILGFLFLPLLVIPGIALAISHLTPLPLSSFTLTVEPKTVIEPHTQATVMIQSFMTDLDRSNITWYVNGAPVQETGRTRTVTVGALGTATNIAVRVLGTDGSVKRQEVIVRPAELELWFEGDGYTPPLYRGRTLASPGTNVAAHAEARFVRENGTRVPAQDITYTWSMNGENIARVSGRAAADARIPTTGLFGSDSIGVEATSVDGAFRASKTVRVPSLEPRLALYPLHPLLGIDFSRAIGSRSEFGEQEITVAAFPFFSKSSGPKDKGLTYAWTVNASKVTPDSEFPFLLTFSKPEKSFGSAQVSLFLGNAYEILQSAQGDWFIGLTERVERATDPFMRVENKAP